MRTPLVSLCLLSLSACGAAIVPEHPGDGDAGTADVSATRGDVPATPADAPAMRGDVPATRVDVPATPVDAPEVCALRGEWRGWWSYREAGHAESRTPIAVRFTGDVTGEGIRPSGAITRGARTRDGQVRFTVGERGGSVGFGFTGTLARGCDAMSGSYATHSFGGSFSLERVRCDAPTHLLSLSGRPHAENLTNAPHAMIAECDRTTSSLYQVWRLPIAPDDAGWTRVWVEVDPRAGVDTVRVSLRAGCDAPSNTCAAPGRSIRMELPAGEHRVVVSAPITRWAPYTLHAERVQVAPESRCETAPPLGLGAPLRLSPRHSLGADSRCGAAPDAVYARLRIPRGGRVTVSAIGADGTTPVRLGARRGCDEFCDAQASPGRDGRATLTLEGDAEGEREVLLSVSSSDHLVDAIVEAREISR